MAENFQLIRENSLFGPEYYRTGFGGVPYERSTHWLNFFRGVADRIVDTLAPRRVLDAGCAWGMLVEALRDRGTDAHGVDISEFAISGVRPDIRRFCRVASLTEEISDSRYDLVTCIEVLEHMSEDEARIAARRMIAVTDAVLFSSTPDDFDEPTHINVRPVLYWLHLFAELGFYPDLAYDASFIAPHAFLVRRGQVRDEPTLRMFDELIRMRGLHVAFVRRQEELERLRATVSTLSSQNDGLHDAATEATRARGRLESSVDYAALAMRNAALEGQVDLLSSELDSVRSSPGWKLILRYRDWLQSNRWRRPWISRYLEPGVIWALRHLGVEIIASSSPQADQSTLEYDRWITENEPDVEQLAIQRGLGATFPYRPLISVLVPVYRVPPAILEETLASVASQTYGNWELCLTVCHDDREAIECLERAAASEPRIRWQILAKNLGISGNSNEALKLATGEFLALLDHDDTLAPFAFFEVVQLLNQDPSANFIYSDKDQLNSDTGRRIQPLFKPQWSPEVMWNANYVTHLNILRTEQVRQIGGWRSETDGAQDWDLFLRIIREFGNVRHLPMVLYHWRQISTSVAARGFAAKPWAAEGQVRAVSDHCSSLKLDSTVARSEHGDLRIQWNAVPGESVSVICVSAQPLDQTIAWIKIVAAKTGLTGVEFLVAGNGGEVAGAPIRCIQIAPGTDRVSTTDCLVRAATGKILVFLDVSVTPADSGWLQELVGPLRCHDIGMVGAKLIDEGTRHIRHCGIVINHAGKPEHLFRGQPEHVYEQLGGASWYRNWFAVSGACFALRREVWDSVSGFSGDPIYPRLDIHLAVRVAAAGRRILYNPYARLFQRQEAILETQLLANDAQGRLALRSFFPKGDPFFTPNLDSINGRLTFRRKAGVKR